MLRMRSLLIAVIALVLMVPVAHAAGGWTIGVSGVLGKATGDDGKDEKIGPVAGIDVCMHVNDRIAVGVEGNWVSNKHKDVGVTVTDPGTGDTDTLNEDTFTILSGGVHGKYMFPVAEDSKVAPYGLVGLGLYNAKTNYQETVVIVSPPQTFVFTDETDGIKGTTRLGGKVGAGAMNKATEVVGVTLQGEYNIVSVDTGGVSGASSTFKFYGIRVGVNFHIMPK